MYHDVEQQLGFNRSARSARSSQTAQSKQPLVHYEMAGTADRQEFRNALEKSENQRMVQLNGSRSWAGLDRMVAAWVTVIRKADAWAAWNTAGAASGPASSYFPSQS